MLEAGPHMPFFVSVHYRAWPGHREALQTAIRNDLSASSATRPGLRFARVFQHLTDSNRFLAFEEWQTEAEYQRVRAAPSYLAALAPFGPPPQADVLERLQMYRHLPHRPDVLDCMRVTISPAGAEAVEDLVCDSAQRDALAGAGLVIRAVYRVVGEPGRLLVLHGWRSLAHLEAYQESVARETATRLTVLGATLDAFVGEVTAEYSWLDR
jgi:quinol monooxygenase YgiN